MQRSFVFLMSVVLCAGIGASTFAQSKTKDKKDKDKAKEKGGEITLKRLFPKESMFGPRASSIEFSADGKYAALLYRDYDGRRHGSDLWLYDVKADEMTRVSNVALMSEFQRSARKVKQDRLAKHAKAEKAKAAKSAKGKDKKGDDKKTDKNDSDEDKADEDGDGETSKDKADKKSDKKTEKKKSKKELEEELKIINSVGDKDADDKDAPRYSGISGFQWHPEKNAMLVFSEGDIYQIEDVTKPSLERMTKTAAFESQVDYLPDGSGYTYNVNNVVHRQKFGDHMIEQLNPRLGSGQNLSNYSLSPDGKRIVVVARSGERFQQGGRTVDIIRYRDRFAKADSVPRTVSDDETKAQDVFVYLFDLETADVEESDLIQVFHEKIDEPRDVISSPKWSLDSNKVTFCFFDQKNSEVQIRVGDFPDEKELKKLRKEAEKTGKAKSGDDEEESTQGRGRRGRQGRRGGAAGRGPMTLKHEADIAYRFKHDGGPNTPGMVSPDWAADNQHIVFVSEQSGFRHVHVLDPLYQSVRQLTSGHYEVYPMKFSKDHKTMFVTATKDSPARTMVYSIDVESGEMKRLSKEDGTYSSVAVSDDGKHMLANFVTFGTLTELVRQNEKGKAKTLTDSHPEEAKELTKWVPELFDYENRHGHTIHGMMFKPDGWTEKSKDKYPLLIYVYGGPLGTRKSVTDGSYSRDGYFFQGYMAHKHGYVTVVIDPRGQSGYGGLFEKSNYEQVGKPQVEDLVDGVKFLTENFHVDEKKVGIHGWSFGGFQTQMCLYTEPDVFHVGMAGAGPTEWENYNSWYTTGTVGPSQKGKPDQKKYSLRPLAKNLKGKLLLVHGMEDTNVLFQDTVAIYRELLQAGKEVNVELFLDPTGGHGLGGDVKTFNRMRKYEDFLLRTLGSNAKKDKKKK